MFSFSLKTYTEEFGSGIYRITYANIKANTGVSNKFNTIYRVLLILERKSRAV